MSETINALERARVRGIKQAVAFVRKCLDSPVIADDIEKYVIPYGYRASTEVQKLAWKLERGEKVKKQ